MRSSEEVKGDEPTGGLPLSVTLRFTLIFPLAAILGVLTGYIINRLDVDYLNGVFTGALAFAVGAVIRSFGDILAGSRPWLELASCAGLGSVPVRPPGFSSDGTLRRSDHAD